MVMKLNGKAFRPGDLEKALKKATRDMVVKHVRDRVEPLRDPETGQFVTVSVDGNDLSTLTMSIEGTANTIARAREALGSEAGDSSEPAPDAEGSGPCVFLSFGWEDHALAEDIATQLIASGIPTWWSDWEIRAGDSLRRKIDQGIGDCTHFVVLLTPTSIDRPWVQEEIDAAFSRKVGDGITLISLRHNVPMQQVPALLAGALCPLLDADGHALRQVINDILGISRRPKLGNKPSQAALPTSDFSPAAMAVAKVFVETSPDGRVYDLSLTMETLQQHTGLTEDDVSDALFELKRWIERSHDTYFANEGLYVEFDRFFMPWKPAEDAILLASHLMQDPDFPQVPSKIVDRLGWSARRLNPAITYLEKREAVSTMRGLGSGHFTVYSIEPTSATRRFLKGRVS